MVLNVLARHRARSVTVQVMGTLLELHPFPAMVAFGCMCATSCELAGPDSDAGLVGSALLGLPLSGFIGTAQ